MTTLPRVSHICMPPRIISPQALPDDDITNREVNPMAAPSPPVARERLAAQLHEAYCRLEAWKAVLRLLQAVAVAAGVTGPSVSSQKIYIDGLRPDTVDKER